MSRLKLILAAIAIIIALIGCSPKKALETQSGALNVQSSSGYINPYPLQATSSTPGTTDNQVSPSTDNQAYPAPQGDSDLPVVSMYPENFVTGLDVPTTTSGKAVITGKLVSATNPENPFISVLYLSVATPDADPSKSPKINFSPKTDPMATQDIKTGQFVFSEINPGQYAIVIWTPGESFFVKDANGSIMVIEAKADEVNDLGLISFK